MKEQIREIIAETSDRIQARNFVREYLQARTLQFLQETGVFRSWIFHGGTALRLLYRMPRYSEDLDFALEKPDPTLDISSNLAKVSRFFEAEAYVIEVKTKEVRTVKSAFIRFPGLLYELRLSPRQTEKFSIKIEVDSNPPKGGTVETTIVRRYVTLHLLHYDKSSLLSGKLQALLTRPYAKGRDLYDIFWYLSDPEWPHPNLEYANSGLRQTGWTGPEITRQNWTHVLERKLESIDWARVVKDVEPFIERTQDLKMLTKKNVLHLLRAKRNM
ncbi:MAG: nucleotidyl transferase AbiEii/AbiGii toxin family protein [Candidatus Aminicenantales bacterium]